MTTDTRTATWRDLADQLTSHQRAMLADTEQLWLGDPRPAEVRESFLLDLARDHIRRSAEDRDRFGDVLAPAEAVHLWHWELDEDGVWSRAFAGTYHRIHGVEVYLLGSQRPDGTAHACVSIDGRTDDLSGTAARELAELLADVGDTVDRINRESPPFM